MSTVFQPAYVIDYPDSDGQPMAESDFQRDPLIYAVESLRLHFLDRKNYYVSGDMFIYYEKGNPKAVVAPDVFVVIGAGQHKRFSYKLWEEPKGPDFIMEITSHSTHTEDQGKKRSLYASLGVNEYWQYDPTSDYLKPELQGLRLAGGNYWPLPGRRLPEGGRLIYSPVLDLELRLSDGEFRFYDPTTGKKLRSHADAELDCQSAEARAEQEAAQRQAAEARAKQEAAQRQAAEARAEQVMARLRAAEAHAAQESAQRQALEARLAELEARLRER
ncbi:Uma2 family endonuclease [Gammaproteobacteria bacterium]